MGQINAALEHEYSLRCAPSSLLPLPAHSTTLDTSALRTEHHMLQLHCILPTAALYQTSLATRYRASLAASHRLLFLSEVHATDKVCSRRRMVLQRLDVMVQSFKYSSRAKVFTTLSTALFTHLVYCRNSCSSLMQLSRRNWLAALWHPT